METIYIAANRRTLRRMLSDALSQVESEPGSVVEVRVQARTNMGGQPVEIVVGNDDMEPEMNPDVGDKILVDVD